MHNERTILDRDALALEHLHIVPQLARVMKRRLPTANYDELVAAGNYALVRAAGAFRGTNDCKFSTYANECIRGRMLRAFARPEGKKRYHEYRWLGLANAASLRADAPLPDALFEHTEARRQLLTFVALLPSSQVQVLSLRFHEGLQFPQIAALLGWHIDKTRKVFRQAVINLRKLYDGEAVIVRPRRSEQPAAQFRAA